MKNELEELKAKNKALTEALEQAAYDQLVAELKALPSMKGCPNVGLVARWIIEQYNYGPNQETHAFQTHGDKERRYATKHEISALVDSMKSDEETAILIRPAAPKWTPPANNPWLPEYFNLTIQGQVVTHDPELAEKWKAEAKRREHALRRVSNA